MMIEKNSYYKQILEEIYRILCENFPDINCEKGSLEDKVLAEDVLKTLKRFIEEYNSYKEQLEGYSLTLEAHLEELSQTYEELSTMFTVSKILSRDINPYELMQDFLNAILNSIPSESAGVLLFHNENEEFFTTDDNPKWQEILNFTRKLFENSRKDVIISEPEDTAFEGIKNFISIPITSNEKIWGYMVLFNKLNGDFYIAADRKILESAAMQLGFSLQNYDYIRKEIERQRLREQLNIAKNIQTSLLPREFPSNDYFEIYAKTLPAIFVGGDYYDIVERNDGNYLIAFADVSGKSVPAALLMSSIRTIVRNFGNYTDEILDFVHRVNRMITNDTPIDQFTTMVLMLLDVKKMKIEVCNAGHNPVIILEKKNGSKKIEATGIPFGIIANFEYETVTLNLGKGDTIFMYTDGISEARNINGEEFGHDRILTILNNVKSKSSKEIVEEIIEEVTKFSKGMNQHDDITAMAIKIF